MLHLKNWGRRGTFFKKIIQGCNWTPSELCKKIPGTRSWEDVNIFSKLLYFSKICFSAFFYFILSLSKHAQNYAPINKLGKQRDFFKLRQKLVSKSKQKILVPRHKKKKHIQMYKCMYDSYKILFPSWNWNHENILKSICLILCFQFSKCNCK